MYIKISAIKKLYNKYGNDLKISRVGLYNEEGKYVKWVKLNDDLIKTLLDAKIEVNINE